MAEATLSALADDLLIHLVGTLRRSDQARMACVSKQCYRSKCAALQAYRSRCHTAALPSMVAAGTSHLTLFDRDGRLLTCGTETADGDQMEHRGCLGQPLPDDSDFLPPTAVREIGGVQVRHLVSVGFGGTAVISNDGTVFTFGLQRGFTFGNGHMLGCTCAAPQRVTMFSHIRVSQLAGGTNHVLIVSAEGAAYSYGHNFFGQLGLGIDTGAGANPGRDDSTYDATIPHRIDALRDVIISSVALV